MNMEETTLDELLEQTTEMDGFYVIAEVPDEPSQVRVTPAPRMIPNCGAGINVPRSAIASVKRIGKDAECCNQILPVVVVTFSDKKVLSYREVFSEMRSNRQPVDVPFIAASTLPGGGGVVANPQNCADNVMRRAVAAGLTWAQVKSLMQTMEPICGALDGI